MSHHAIYDSMQDNCADILTPVCPFCGQQGWITVPEAGADALMDGQPVQDALPELDHRQGALMDGQPVQDALP